MKIGISKEARNDLASIARTGKRNFGVTKAKAYEKKLRNSFALIGLYPELAHLREGTTRPIRIHPCGAHLIIYSSADQKVSIIRVLHSNQNWEDHI